MKKTNYKKFYDRVGKTIGWDFSNVNSSSEGVKWEFYDKVVKVANPTDKLLDIGTGGGHRVLKIADGFTSIVGIDNSSAMIKTANENLVRSKLSNVEFKEMDAFDLEFPDNSFDLVTSRHCDFSPKEVYRVLRRDGYFMTQQVGESDKLNIKKAFGRGQAYGVRNGMLRDRYLNELKSVRFNRIKVDEYDATKYYKTSKDSVFLLEHTPIIPDFGKSEKDFVILEKFIKENAVPKGIKTNAKRFMITVRK